LINRSRGRISTRFRRRTCSQASQLKTCRSSFPPLVLYPSRNVLNKADTLLKGGLKGKTVLIQGGLSVTGSIAIQLTKHVYGATRVITTVSTNKRPLIAQYLGEGTVDQIIDYKAQDIHKEIPPASIDFVYDTLGILTSLIPLVKPSGVLLTIAAMPRRARNAVLAWLDLGRG
jgi:NADPH:quinone reductase-like Zn-dependent oxidoreductase